MCAKPEREFGDHQAQADDAGQKDPPYSIFPVARLRRPVLLASVEDLHVARSVPDLNTASSLTSINVRHGKDSYALADEDRHESVDVTESPANDTGDPSRREPLSAWLLLARVFLYTVISGVSWSTFSLYYVEYTEYFGASKGAIGWIVSIQNTVSFLFSIFVSAPIDAYGCAPIAALGGLISALGLALSSLAPSVGCLIITQGFITGAGLCCVYMSGSVVVQQHFYKNRALSNGIALLGYSTGSFIGPIIIRYLTIEYGWRGAILLHAGITLHCLPLGATFWRPEGYVRPKTTPSLRDLWANITDFRIMRQPIFALYVAAGVCHRYNNTALIHHLPSRAVWLGVDKNLAAYLPSVMSLANTCVRIPVSILTNIRGCDRQAVMTFGVSLEGAANVMMLGVSGYLGCQLAAATLGTGMGIDNTLATVVLVDLMGMDNLSRGLGIYNTVLAFALFVATPFTGFIYDQTGNYNYPFYVSLVSSVFSVCFMVAIIIVRRVKSQDCCPTVSSLKDDTKEEKCIEILN